MTENNLENRFQNFKQNFKKEIYGQQWENDRKNFDIVYANGKFKSFGKWNFLPAIYENQFKDDQLLNIYYEKNIKFLTLGSQKLCLPKEYGNKTLIYANNYYELVQNYINEKSIVCEIGSGSGLFSALINEKKNTTNILIDIPEVRSSKKPAINTGIITININQLLFIKLPLKILAIKKDEIITIPPVLNAVPSCVFCILFL